jgi:hypothetical protein
MAAVPDVYEHTCLCMCMCVCKNVCACAVYVNARVYDIRCMHVFIPMRRLESDICMFMLVHVH